MSLLELSRMEEHRIPHCPFRIEIGLREPDASLNRDGQIVLRKT